jgi:hypothetical protein
MQFLQMINSNPFILVPILVWTVAWKGMALWKASRNNQPYWFIALLVINTVGLLEIVYLMWFQKKQSRTR